MINGEVYVVEDKGGAIKGDRIDMFCGTEAKSYELGVYHAEVYVKGK